VEGTTPSIFTNKPYFIKNLEGETTYLGTNPKAGLNIGRNVRTFPPDRSDFQKWILERSP
jgi:hypothetical protein